MKKIIVAILLVALTAFAQQADNGIVNVTKNKYGTEMSFYPNTSIEAGHVYSVIMNDCDGFKSIEIKYMDGRVQYYSFEDEKIPSVTTRVEDRVLSWESLTKPKFMKAWNEYFKYFKDYIG